MSKKTKKISESTKKTIGRPRKPDELRRDKYLSTRFTADEIATIKRLGGKDYSAWVRSRLGLT